MRYLVAVMSRKLNVSSRIASLSSSSDELNIGLSSPDPSFATMVEARTSMKDRFLIIVVISSYLRIFASTTPKVSQIYFYGRNLRVRMMCVRRNNSSTVT